MSTEFKKIKSEFADNRFLVTSYDNDCVNNKAIFTVGKSTYGCFNYDEIVNIIKSIEFYHDLLKALQLMVKEFSVVEDSKNEIEQEKAIDLANKAIKKALN